MTDRRASYEARNPEWSREYRRRKSERANLARKLMRERFRAEYREVLDRALPPSRRYRAAITILRERHPAEWEACLQAAREEQNRG